MLRAAKAGSERATERVAVLMTPAEKAAYADHASRMGLSLGQFFREAGASYASAGAEERADADALESALKQLELSTARTEAALDSALAEVRAPVTTVIRMNDKVEAMAGLMKEQQRRIDEFNGRIIRLETVLEIALHRAPLQSHRLAESASDSGTLG